MKNILKRQETRKTIDGLKIKNPTGEQVKYIQEILEANVKFDADNGLALTKEDKSMSQELIKYMLRELVEGLPELTDEEVMDVIADPSLTLRKINVEFNEIISEITQTMLITMLTNLKETNLMLEADEVMKKLDVLTQVARKKALQNKSLESIASKPKKTRKKKVK